MFIAFLSLSERAAAHVERAKIWLGVLGQKPFCPESKWLWSFNGQTRFIAERESFEGAFVEPLIGYKFNGKSFWVGNRYLYANNKPRPSFSENRLVQQIIYPLNINENKWSFRFRVEESFRNNQKQVNLRYRQRVAVEFPRFVFCDNPKPFIFNESFITLNKTNYTSHQFVHENRLFLGVNYYLNKKSWWEIGYLFQYTARRPQNPNYELNHVLYIIYNFR